MTIAIESGEELLLDLRSEKLEVKIDNVEGNLTAWRSISLEENVIS